MFDHLFRFFRVRSVHASYCAVSGDLRRCSPENESPVFIWQQPQCVEAPPLRDVCIQATRVLYHVRGRRFHYRRRVSRTSQPLGGRVRGISE